VTKLELVVVLVVSEFLVKMGILQKISKIEKEKFSFQIKALMPFTARKNALKREGIKAV